MTHDTFVINRRIFLAATAATLGTKVVVAANGTKNVGHTPADDWLEAVRNSQAPLFLDAGSFSLSFSHFDRATAYLKGEEAQGNRAVALIGLHGTGLAHGLSVKLWKEWDLSSQIGVKFADGERNESEIRAWLTETSRQFPGRVAVLACERTLTRWSAMHVSAEGSINASETIQSLIPGVVVVPAMVTAAARAQHEGAAYVLSKE